jgi:XFP C-terminal domain
VIDRVPGLGQRTARLRQLMLDTLTRHHAYTREHGEDLPEVAGWTWPGAAPGGTAHVRAANTGADEGIAQ